MTSKLLRFAPTLLACVLFLAVSHRPAFALTTDDTVQAVKVKKHKKKSVKRPAEGAQSLYGSNETQKMRDKRLSRECKGAANGGACRGYTQ